MKLAHERGACPDAADYGIMERFSNKMAIAPTASISIICGGASPGIEPIAANVYTHKTLSGSFSVRNPYLREAAEPRRAGTTEDIWSSIITTEGSVQHLDFLDDQEKAVFKTAFEIDQRWLIEHAADRTPFICQASRSTSSCRPTSHKRDLHQIHLMAWKKGVKIAVLLPFALDPARRRRVQRRAVGAARRPRSRKPKTSTPPLSHRSACRPVGPTITKSA